MALRQLIFKELALATGALDEPVFPRGHQVTKERCNAGAMPHIAKPAASQIRLGSGGYAPRSAFNAETAMPVAWLPSSNLSQTNRERKTFCIGSFWKAAKVQIPTLSPSTNGRLLAFTPKRGSRISSNWLRHRVKNQISRHAKGVIELRIFSVRPANEEWA